VTAYLKKEISNMKIVTKGMLAGFMIMVLAVTVWTGCEDSPTGEEVLMTVTPQSASLAPGRTVVFTASLPEELTNSVAYFPLEWKMSSPELGKFLETEGNTAIYQALAHGINTITVRDQSAREGSAVITQ
jgi:hypothetical protein